MTDADSLPACPDCASEFTYAQGGLLVCPMCGHEWVDVSDEVAAAGTDPATPDGRATVTDAVGNQLVDGDSVSIVKNLKVHGSGGGVIKVGTKVRGIRLLDEPVDGHDIEAKVPGFGSMRLKSSIVKKA